MHEEGKWRRHRTSRPEALRREPAPRRNIMRSLAPTTARPKPLPRHRLAETKWPPRPFTSFISPGTTKRSKSPRSARTEASQPYSGDCPQYESLAWKTGRTALKERICLHSALREKLAPGKAWQGLAKTRLQVGLTSHCPFCFKEQKELGKDDFTKIPKGRPGIEHRLSLVLYRGSPWQTLSPNRLSRSFHAPQQNSSAFIRAKEHRRRIRRRSESSRSPSTKKVHRRKTIHARGLLHVGGNSGPKAGQNLCSRGPCVNRAGKLSAAPAPANSSAAKHNAGL